MEQQRGRRGGIDLLFERELLCKGLVGIFGAEQLYESPLMAFVRVGRDHRVEEDHAKPGFTSESVPTLPAR
ncbi:MAG: hypothetical protein ACLUQ6_08685 [Alistipes onderdonkii]